MRIAQLSPYTSPVLGGISSYTRELAATYSSMGLDHLGLAVSGATNEHFEVLGPGKIAFVFRALAELVNWRPDVVHSHAHWYALLPGILLKLMRPETRVLFTFHTEPETGRHGLRMKAMVALLRLCDGVGFVSDALKRTTNLPDSIPQAVVLGAPERRPVRLVDVAHRTRRADVLFVGPLAWPRKVAGVLLLLEAFAGISNTSLGWRVVVIGDGPFRKLVEDKVAELGLQDSVELKGLREDVLSEIETVEMYAQISLQEGLPLSLLNAMAAGTPVIATRVGGMPEVITHCRTGYLVEPTKSSVADGLKTLMQDADFRRGLGVAAQTWISAELTWEKVARRHLELLSQGTA